MIIYITFIDYLVRFARFNKAKNQTYKWIFIFLFTFLLNKLDAQENVKSAWRLTIDVSTEQMLNDCKFFGGDTLNGFNLPDTIVKVRNIYNSYIEVKSCIFKKEADFVKSKYNIVQLPFESALIQNEPVLSLKSNSGCNNVDFEDGDFTGWTGGKGYNAVSINSLSIFNNGIYTLGADAPRKSCSYHTIVTSASGDDFYGNYPVLCPNGGTYSVRLGGDNVNIYNGTDCNNLYSCGYPGPDNPLHAAGEVLEQSFIVSATNTLFTFYYAASLNDGGHEPGEQPYFAIQVYDSLGNPINCFSHRIELVAGVVPQGGVLSSNGNCIYSSTSSDYNVYSIPWQADSYNLSAYIGQTLTVKFTAAGCTYGGHFGIGYFDAKCGPAEITSSNSTPCAGDTVVLTAPPSASGTYSWIGPGIIGNNNTQDITVNVSGIYSVTVGSGACAYTLSLTLTFSPYISVTATPALICSGESSTLTASGETTYIWMPGNLSESSVNVTPTSTTTYTVYSTINGCSTTLDVTVNVNSVPLVTAIASPDTICIGVTSTLTASGASTYNWSGFGNGNLLNVTPIVTTAYTVTGTDVNGCSNSIIVTVTVNPLPNISVNSSPSDCNGGNNGTATVTTNGGTSPYSYNWSNGANTDYVSGLFEGDYYVTISDNNGCSVTTMVTVSVTPSVITNFPAIPAFCSGSVAPLLLNTSPNGIIGTWSPATINNTTSGTYTFTPNSDQCAITQNLNVTVTPQIIPDFAAIPAFCSGLVAPVLVNTSPDGIIGIWIPATINNITSGTYTFIPSAGQCAANSNLSITVNPLPTITATAFPSTICNGQNSILTVVGASTYTWMPGNLSGSSINVAPTAVTVYTITGTTSAGCIGSASLEVVIAPEFTINFTSIPKEGCAPLNVQFDYLSDGMMDTNLLHWNFGDLMTNEDVSNLLSPSYTFNDQGNFIVSLSGVSIYGCAAVGYDTIKVWPIPSADFMMHPEVAETDNPLITFFDQSLNAINWHWDFGNSESDYNNYSNIQYPSHNYTNSGNFTVQLIVSNEFECLDTAVKIVKIIESFALYTPNAFTPNGDENNEGFRGQGVGINEDKFEMYIYDRWGKVIFRSNNFNEAWDGKDSQKGVECEQEIYVWIINLTDKSGLQHSLKGTVMLIR